MRVKSYFDNELEAIDINKLIKLMKLTKLLIAVFFCKNINTTLHVNP